MGGNRRAVRRCRQRRRKPANTGTAGTRRDGRSAGAPTRRYGRTTSTSQLPTSQVPIDFAHHLPLCGYRTPPCLRVSQTCNSNTIPWQAFAFQCECGSLFHTVGVYSPRIVHRLRGLFYRFLMCMDKIEGTVLYGMAKPLTGEVCKLSEPIWAAPIRRMARSISASSVARLSGSRLCCRA